jgi:hypothetical protein
MHTGELPHNNFAVVFAQSHASWFKILSFNHLWNQGECTEIEHAKKRHTPLEVASSKVNMYTASKMWP